MTRTRTMPGRGIRLLLAAMIAAVVTVLTLAPPAIAAPLRGLVVRSIVEAGEPFAGARSLGMPPFGDLDDVLNLLLFVPLGATLALLLARRRWPLAILGGLALSAAVEFAQRSVPGRVPDPDDVLWNTIGAAVGVLVVAVPRLALAAARRQRGSVTRT